MTEKCNHNTAGLVTFYMVEYTKDELREIKRVKRQSRRNAIAFKKEQERYEKLGYPFCESLKDVSQMNLDALQHWGNTCRQLVLERHSLQVVGNKLKEFIFA